MFRVFFLILFSLPSIGLFSQQRLNFDPSKGCNYDGASSERRTIYGFDSSLEAQEVVQQIVKQVFLDQNFTIMAADVANAQAQFDASSGERYILYSQQFMNDLENRTGDYWAKIAVLAHEVGHHLNNHLLGRGGNRLEEELEADKFSGAICYRLGASLEQAQLAVREIAPVFDTPTHPRRRTRLEAVAVGYKYAEEQSGGMQKTPTGVYNPPPSGNTVTLGGQGYKTARLKDGKTWLTENLNYNVGSGSYCYDDDPANCRRYGRLYTWEAAKRACAALGNGWRLPTDAEWRALAMDHGGLWDGSDKGDPKKAYSALLEGGSSGFAALLGGYRYPVGSFSYLGAYGYYWSDTEKDTQDAWRYYFYSSNGKLDRNADDKSYGFSCRCMKGAPSNGID